MSRDTLVTDRNTPNGAPHHGATLLDTSLTLPGLTVTSIAASLALLAGFILRFTGLDRWPLSVAEAELAHAADHIVRGTSSIEHLVGAPATVNWIALFFFAGWPDDSVARIAMAVAGFLTILLCLALRPMLGSSVSIWGGVLVAASPTLIATSRRIDGGALIVLLTLVLIGCLRMRSLGRSLGWSSLAGVVTALLALTGPLGIPAVLIAWLAAILLVERGPSLRLDDLAAGIAAGLATVVLTTTVFLTRPSGLTSSLGELLTRLWDLHLSQVGQRSWLPAFNILLNEPLLLVLAVVALVAAPNRSLTRALGIWSVASFLLFSVLGDVSVQGFAAVVLPLALLAGIGIAHLVERLPWHAIRQGNAAIYISAVLLMVAAAVSLVGLLSGGPGDDTLEWMTRFLLVVVVGVLPLSITLSWLGQRLAGDRLVLVLSASIILLSALTTRSAVLAASERPGLPGDPLATDATSASIGVVVARLHRVSRDLTMAERSSMDPGGGHGLRIAIDERIHEPFAWYFRAFPNAYVFDPDESVAPFDADIVILDGSRDGRAIAPGYVGESYPFAPLQPETLHSPDWADLLAGVVSPDDWRSLGGYLVNRVPATTPAQRQFQVFATGVTSDVLFAATGPFNLDDRPGAGAQPGQLNRPRGVAVGPDGSIYVVDSRNARVNVYQQDGTYQFSFGSDGSGPGQLARLTSAAAGGASGIALDTDGNIYVADTWNHRIQVFAPDGTFLRGWGQFFDALDDPVASTQSPGAFYGPRGLAFHEGLLYVTDTGNERVQVFEPDGGFVRMFGVPGDGEGQLREPVGIAVSPDGTVYIADSHNARIASFTTDGDWVAAIVVEVWSEQRFFEPYVTLGPGGNLYTTASALGLVLEIDPSTAAAAPLASTELRQPFGVAIGPDITQLLVTDGIVQSVLRIPVAMP